MRNPLPNGFLIRKESAGKGLIDDHDSSRLFVIAGGEAATAPQRHADRSEISRRHDAIIGKRLFTFLERRSPDDLNRGTDEAVAHRKKIGRPRGLDAGQGFEPSEQLIKKAAPLRFRISLFGKP